MILDRFGPRVLHIHLDCTTQRVAHELPLLLLLLLILMLLLLVELLVLTLHSTVHLYGLRLSLRMVASKQLLSCRISLGLRGFLFLHLYLLLNAGDLISNTHRIGLHLLAHLVGAPSSFRVSCLNHFTHTDLLLSQVHHLKVTAYL